MLAIGAQLCRFGTCVYVAERLAGFDFGGSQALRVVAFETRRCVLLARGERCCARAQNGEVKRMADQVAARDAHAQQR